jgi:hypothetical protein
MQVFVPRLQLRARACMLAPGGVVRLPLTGNEDADRSHGGAPSGGAGTGGGVRDVFAQQAARQYEYRVAPDASRYVCECGCISPIRGVLMSQPQRSCFTV